ncbi:LemA family protein [bacterium]|nr:LemA family protein [bacterium]
MKTKLLSFLGLLILLNLNACGYNSLVSADEAVSGSWAQVENVYQRRADLIPNLVETVKGYASHEKETLEGVIEARSNLTKINLTAEDLDNPEKMARFQEAQNQITSALSKLMLLKESYPDLKANQNFLALQSQLEGTENRIAVERQRFNEASQYYNTLRRKFPTVLIAKMFDFKEKAYFKSDAGSEKAPTVKFN